MMHDVLLALAGFPGDVFVYVPPGSSADASFSTSQLSAPDSPEAATRTGGLLLSPKLAGFFTPAEEELLNRIVVSGFHLIQIRDFVSSVETDFPAFSLGSASSPFPLSSSRQEERRSEKEKDAGGERDGDKVGFKGFYVSALARAMDAEVQEYLTKLVEIEAQVLLQPLLPLSAVYVLLATERQKLATLYEIVTKIRSLALMCRDSCPALSPSAFVAASSLPHSARQHVFQDSEAERGVTPRSVSLPCGPLLDLLWAGSRSGNPLVQQVYRQVLDACVHVFIFQLSSWLFAGQLQDPFGEFFLSRRSSLVPASPSSSPSSSSIFTNLAVQQQTAKHVAPRRENASQAVALSLSSSHGPARSSSSPSSSSPSSSSPSPSSLSTDSLFVYEDLTQPLSPSQLCFEWESAFSLVAFRLPSCCFPTPKLACPSASGASLCSTTKSEQHVHASLLPSPAAAGTALFVGRAVRILTRSGLWGEAKVQQLKPLVARMRRAFRHPSSPASVLLPCLEILRRIVGRLLWELISEEAALEDQLVLLHDFFLLGHGHFFQVFLDAATRCTRRHLSSSFASAASLALVPSTSRQATTFELQLRRSWQQAISETAFSSGSFSSASLKGTPNAKETCVDDDPSGSTPVSGVSGERVQGEEHSGDGGDKGRDGEDSRAQIEDSATQPVQRPAGLPTSSTSCISPRFSASPRAFSFVASRPPTPKFTGANPQPACRRSSSSPSSSSSSASSSSSSSSASSSSSSSVSSSSSSSSGTASVKRRSVSCEAVAVRVPEAARRVRKKNTFFIERRKVACVVQGKEAWTDAIHRSFRLRVLGCGFEVADFCAESRRAALVRHAEARGTSKARSCLDEDPCGFRTRASPLQVGSQFLLRGFARVLESGVLVLGEGGERLRQIDEKGTEADGVEDERAPICPLSACLHADKQSVTHGFKHSIQFRVSSLPSPTAEASRWLDSPGVSPDALEEPLGGGFAVVFQSSKTPASFRPLSAHGSPKKTETALVCAPGCPLFWPEAGDCVAVEVRVAKVSRSVFRRTLDGGEDGGEKEDFSESLRTLQLDEDAVLVAEVAVFLGGKNAKNTFQQGSSSDSAPDGLFSSFANSSVASAAPQTACTSEAKPSADVCMLQRAQRVWRLHACEDLGEELFTLKLHYLAEHHELRVYIQRVADFGAGETRARLTEKEKKYQQPSLRERLQESPLLRVSLFDLSQAMTTEQGAAFVGLFSVPLLHRHRTSPPSFFRATQGEAGRGRGPVEDFPSCCVAMSRSDCPVIIQEWSHEAHPAPLQLPSLLFESSTSTRASSAPFASASPPSSWETRNDGDGGDSALAACPRGKPRTHAELWQQLQLLFLPRWPTPLLISTRNLDCYNALFQFLLEQRHLQFELQRLWLDAGFIQKRLWRPRRRAGNGKRISPRASSPCFVAEDGDDEATACWDVLWTLRARMAFLLGHVLHHLLTVVVQPAFRQLQSVVRESEDFELVKCSHDSFLLQLASKCWLRLSSLLRPFLHSLQSVRRFIDVFALLVDRHTAVAAAGTTHRGEQARWRRTAGDARGSQGEKTDLDLSANSVSGSLCFETVMSTAEWRVVRQKLRVIRDDLHRSLSAFFAELAALRQNPLHAQLDALMVDFDFNGFFSDLTGRGKLGDPLSTHSPQPPPAAGASRIDPTRGSSGLAASAAVLNFFGGQPSPTRAVREQRRPGERRPGTPRHGQPRHVHGEDDEEEEERLDEEEVEDEGEVDYEEEGEGEEEGERMMCSHSFRQARSEIEARRRMPEQFSGAAGDSGVRRQAAAISRGPTTSAYSSCGHPNPDCVAHRPFPLQRAAASPGRGQPSITGSYQLPSSDVSDPVCSAPFRYARLVTPPLPAPLFASFPECGEDRGQKVSCQEGLGFDEDPTRLRGRTADALRQASPSRFSETEARQTEERWSACLVEGGRHCMRSAGERDDCEDLPNCPFNSSLDTATNAGMSQEGEIRERDGTRDAFYTDLQARARAALREARERAARRRLLQYQHDYCLS
ncbi:UNVERIFIED_CONTAM: Spc97 / Spc98 family protein [Hammondia hammondi]|eukprot:XP_008886947.1 Spc97 / Spc98 family protein [Hammondia hammondi]